MTEDGTRKDIPHHDFATVLGAVLESASAMFPGADDFDLRFAVSLVGKMGGEEFPHLAERLPVIADLSLDEELDQGAAILTDIPTASALSSLVSIGVPEQKTTLDEDDFILLREALSPLLDALSEEYERAVGRPFGSIETVFLSDSARLEQTLEKLRGPLCRATVSLTVGDASKGQLDLVLPMRFTELLAESRAVSEEPAVRRYEHVELEETETRKTQPGAEARREPLMENIDLILDIQLKLTARLGQVEMPIGEILKLSPGSVIDIDRFADEPIELVVNDRPIARGEIVVVQENFGIKITEIISKKERIESLR